MAKSRSTNVPGALLALVATGTLVFVVLLGLAANLLPHNWGEATTPALVLTLLVVWAVGSIALGGRRRH